MQSYFPPRRNGSAFSVCKRARQQYFFKTPIFCANALIIPFAPHIWTITIFYSNTGFVVFHSSVEHDDHHHDCDKAYVVAWLTGLFLFAFCVLKCIFLLSRSLAIKRTSDAGRNMNFSRNEFRAICLRLYICVSDPLSTSPSLLI